MQRRHLIAALLGAIPLSQLPLAIAQSSYPEDRPQFWEYDREAGCFSASFWLTSKDGLFQNVLVEQNSDHVAEFYLDGQQVSLETARQDVRFKAALMIGRAAKKQDSATFNRAYVLLFAHQPHARLSDVLVYDIVVGAKSFTHIGRLELNALSGAPT